MKSTLKKRLFAILMSICFAGGTIALFPAEADARPGNGDVTADVSVFQPYMTQKTLDLTDSGIEISLTKEEIRACYDKADELALNWLMNVLIISDTSAEVNAEVKSFYVNEEYADRYWFETVLSDRNVSGEVEALLEKIRAKETTEALLADEELVSRLKELEAGPEGARYLIAAEYVEALSGKVEEIANDLISDKLTAQMESKLNFKFDFQAEQIREEEYEKYGINGTDVQAGTLPEPLKIHTVDFGAKDQFYDAVLNDYVADVFAGRVKEAAADSEDNTAALLRDGRDAVDHLMFIDGGMLMSSDDSQISGGALRGKGGTKTAEDMTEMDAYNAAKGDFSYFRDTTWPGVISLLSVADELNTYAWGRLGLPGGKYTQTLNLHLNPAVVYLAAYPSADLVTGATFDEDGRLTSVSKPYAYEEEVMALFNQGAFGALEDGVYRYKVTESPDYPKDLGNGLYMKDNTQEFLMDLNKVSGEYEFRDGRRVPYERVFVTFHRDAEAARTVAAVQEAKISQKKSPRLTREDMKDMAPLAHAFVNGFTRDEVPGTQEVPEKKIIKTIEGSDKFTLRSLEDTFEYEIMTTVPDEGDSFQIVDELVDVLEFAEPEGTVVSIDGKALSAEEQAKVLDQTSKKLTVSLTGDQVKAYAGKEIAVAFRARLALDADLTAYFGQDNSIQVPNYARYTVGNVSNQNPGVALLNVPDEEITSKENSPKKPGGSEDSGGNPVLEDEAGQLVADKGGSSSSEGSSGSSGSSGHSSKTGDAMKMAVPIILILAALGAGAAVVIRRRK